MLSKMHRARATSMLYQNIMTGIVRFRPLAEAIRQSYQVCDKTPTGYLLRIMTAQGLGHGPVRDASRGRSGCRHQLMF